MAASPKYLNHGFFNAIKTATNEEKSPLFVDVGGNGDCGFRSIAAGLIDQFLMHPHKNAPWLTKLLTNHFNYFPGHRTTLPGLTTAPERMEQLIKSVRVGELLQSMAYTLRQISVTEMCAHPEFYRGAFVDRNEGTTPEDMRKPTTWIDESSIAALAKAMAVSIEVQVVERVKSLPMRLRYNETSTDVAPAVVMQLKNGHYIPRVSSNCFSAVNTRLARTLSPVTNGSPQDPSLTEIYSAIALEDKRLNETFESTHRRLATMVSAGELSKDDLLSCYIKGMASSDYLSGRVAHVSVEHGNQYFFDAINRVQQTTHKGSLRRGDYDQQITDELIHALARAMTIGQMSSESVFAQIDEAQAVGPR